MQVNYKNKCGTCIHIKPNIKNKYGECAIEPSKGLGHLSLSRGKCRNYKLNEDAYCKCGIFIQGGWNYCSNCGKVVGGISNNELTRKDLQFVHGYLLVNIYTLMVNAHEHVLLKARKIRDDLNKKHVHPDNYPADAKDPYILVVVGSGEVIG